MRVPNVERPVVEDASGMAQTGQSHQPTVNGWTKDVRVIRSTVVWKSLCEEMSVAGRVKAVERLLEIFPDMK